MFATLLDYFFKFMFLSLPYEMCETHFKRIPKIHNTSLGLVKMKNLEDIENQYSRSYFLLFYNFHVAKHLL